MLGSGTYFAHAAEYSISGYARQARYCRCAPGRGAAEGDIPVCWKSCPILWTVQWYTPAGLKDLSSHITSLQLRKHFVVG